MAKKLSALLLVLLMLAAIVPTAAFAVQDARAATGISSGECGDCIWIFDPSSGTMTLSGSGKMADYNDRNSIPWYSFRDSIKKVVIGDNVTAVGKGSFYDCTQIASVTIGRSVTIIGDSAFYHLAITGVTIPDSVEAVGYCAFFGCTNLKELSIGRGVVTVGAYAFENTALTCVTIPESVTSIGKCAFGYRYADRVDAPVKGFVIKGSTDAASAYAAENGFSYVKRVVLGDTDGDGKVTILDATAIQRRLADMSTQSFIEAAADVDGDGKVTILDATAIQRVLAGMTTQAEGVGELV